MTVIDILLHKWLMLDDRRRRIIMGSVIIVILLVGLTIYLSSSSSTSSSSSITKLVSSGDKHSLAALSLELQVTQAPQTYTINVAKLEELQVKKLGGKNRYDVVMICAGGSIELIGTFFLDEKQGMAAGEMYLSFRSPKNVVSTCLMVPPVEGVKLFAAPPGKHYFCDKKLKIECKLNDSGSSFSLTIVEFELELDRKEPVGVTPSFETPAFSC